jgi:hypothetical protein
MKKGKKKKRKKISSLDLFFLALNPSIGAFDWSILNIPVPSQGWCAGLCDDGCCPSLLDSVVGSQFGGYECCLLWCDGLSGAGKISKGVLPGGWCVGSH